MRTYLSQLGHSLRPNVFIGLEDCLIERKMARGKTHTHTHTYKTRENIVAAGAIKTFE